MELTDEQEAQIRMLADNFDDLVAQRYRVLLEEVDALRAGWDIETRMRMDAMAERDSAVAHAEAAEAERDEALTALGEHVIATEHDRDEYLALQRVIVERDNENEALRARLAECAETHGNSELMKSDALMVLTVYDAHVLPENRGEWRDRLLAWASPAALEEPVATVPAPGGSDVNEILAASRAAVVEPVGEPPRPLEHTPFAMPDGAERCAADGLPWPCPEVVGEPPRPEENMDQDESNEHARPDRAEIPPEPMSDGERLAYMGTDAARWADQFLGVLAWSPDGLTPSVDFGLMVGWFANAIEAGRNASAVGDPQPPTCANPECLDGRVRDPSGLPLCSENGILGYSPCPSCTPPDPESGH